RAALEFNREASNRVTNHSVRIQPNWIGSVNHHRVNEWLMTAPSVRKMELYGAKRRCRLWHCVPGRRGGIIGRLRLDNCSRLDNAVLAPANARQPFQIIGQRK